MALPKIVTTLRASRQAHYLTATEGTLSTGLKTPLCTIAQLTFGAMTWRSLRCFLLQIRFHPVLAGDVAVVLLNTPKTGRKTRLGLPASAKWASRF